MFSLVGFFGEVIVGMMGHNVEQVGVLKPDEIANVKQLILGDEAFFRKELGLFEDRL